MKMASSIYFGKNKEMKRGGIVTLSLLACIMLGSFAIATATVLSLEPEDRISMRRGACLSILGFVFFVSLFDLINHLALRTSHGIRFRKKYQLTTVDVFDISNKLVSAVQASLSCLTGVICCAWSCTRSFLKSSHFMSEAYAWFGAAYFFYDIWSMYKVHVVGLTSVSTVSGAAIVNGDGRKTRSEPQLSVKVKSYVRQQPIIIMHHLVIGSFGFLVIVYLRGGLGDCVFGFVYLMELSTPFVSLRGILSRMHMKTSRLYIVNGLLMLASFFFCRVAMFPYVCYLYSQVVDLPYLEAIMSLPRGCKIGILIILLPQVYWFFLMLKGALKTFLYSDKKLFAPNGSRKRLRLHNTHHSVTSGGHTAHS